jgi:hypothetical protein
MCREQVEAPQAESNQAHLRGFFFGILQANYHGWSTGAATQNVPKWQVNP